MIQRIRRAMLCFLFLLLSSVSVNAEKVRFAIPSRSVSIMPIFVAFKEGFYRDEEMDVEIINMSSQMAVTATVAGSVDFSSSPGSATNAAVRGIDLKTIFVVGQKPLHDLITHPSIRSFGELKGKIVGVDTFGSMSDFLTRAMLRKNGLEPDRDVAVRMVGTDNLRIAALKNGIVSASVMTLPYNFLAVKDGFRRLAYAGDYEEVIIGGVVTTGKLLKDDPGKASRFVRATLKGLNFYKADKPKSLFHMTEFLKIQDSHFLEGIYDYHQATLTDGGIISSNLMERVIEDAKRFTKTDRDVRKEDVFDFSLAEKFRAQSKRNP
jgi:NitT/TauT family transport system substrate-binding protein